MRTNLLPSLILAAAILGSALIVTRALDGFRLERQLGAILGRAERTSASPEGAARLSKLAEGFSRSIATGLRTGFDTNGAKDAAQDAVRGKLQFSEIGFAPSGSPNLQRVVGVLHNGSDRVVSNVQVSVTFRDAAGKLMDVVQTSVPGVAAPGAELAFQTARPLGVYSAAGSDFDRNRAATVKAEVTSCLLR